MHQQEEEREKCQPPRGRDNLMVYLAVMTIADRLWKVEAELGTLIKQGAKNMKTLDEVLEKVREANTVDKSLIALTRGIKAKLDAIIAGGLPPVQQAKVDALFTEVETGQKDVADAVLENTPADPEPSA